MESQRADANEELLLELKSKNTTRSIKDFSPEGISLESNLEGALESGLFAAGRIFHAARQS